jgi:predicted dehydrogenase
MSVATPEPPSTGPLRVGLIGAGGIATAHLVGYEHHADSLKVAAVCERDPLLRERRTRELDVPGFADYREMLESIELDAVDVCLPHDLHADAVLAAIAHGVHVLCEKPLAVDSADIDTIARAAEEAGVAVVCAHNQLFRPEVAAVAKIIREAGLGRVYDISVTGLYRPEFDPATIGWRGRAGSSGGGELMDSGFHAVYVLLHLMSSVPRWVSATLARHRLDFLPAEDTAYVTVEFDDGAVGSVTTTWAYDPVGPGETIAVHLEGGSVHADATGIDVRRVGGGSERIELQPADALSTYVAEIAHLGRVLREGETPIAGPAEAAATLDIVRAAYVSAETGRRVETAVVR